MKFYRNKDNKDYLMITIEEYLAYAYTYGQPEVEEEMKYEMMLKALSNQNFTLDVKIAIPTASSLGEFLLTNVDNVSIIDEDELITEDKIQNALLAVIYDNKDHKLLNKLENMFREEITGTISELEQLGYDRSLLEKIAQAEDIDIHKRKRKKIYIPENVVVFEEGNILYKNLVNGDYQYKKTYK